MKVTTAIILAGGLGTRLHSTVPDLPKPMAPVNERPFLEYQIDYWIGQGIDRFILSVGYLWEIIAAHFGETYRGAGIEYAIEEVPQGTGGGLLLAMEKLNDQHIFLLLNGDTFFEVNLCELAYFHANCSSDWTFSLFRANERGRYMGMEVDDKGRVTSLESGTREPRRFANGGVYMVNPGILRKSDWQSGKVLSIEKDIMPSLFAAGARLHGHICDGRFIDIGVPEDYFRSAKILGT
jgi:D-glycero-alpha-D-manno-heptose 1-phosphate guanylyltransferase